MHTDNPLEKKHIAPLIVSSLRKKSSLKKNSEIRWSEVYQNAKVSPSDLNKIQQNKLTHRKTNSFCY
jgi:hypothetical protein